VIGTAFAVSPKLALSAWHNLSENGFRAGDVILLCKEVNEGVVLRSSPVVTVFDYHEDEDWVLLELVGSGSVFTINASLCPEAELPPDRDGAGQSVVVGIRDFPAGLISSFSRLTVASTQGKIWNYSSKVTPQTGVKKLRLADQFPPSEQNMINVCGGRVAGSCGAPYFASNGKVIAFHVASVNDADSADAKSSNGHSHTSYSEGHVLARLAVFTSKHAHLF
jgi:hypothetical protein